MTKTQQKNEDSIKSLEEKFNKIIAALRDESNNRKFKKQHNLIVSELKLTFNHIQQRLQPGKSGPLQW